MKIVLLTDFDKLGKRGDIIDVADGYARNYLIPRKHAIAATRGITDQANAMRAARDKADAKLRENAVQTAGKLMDVTLRIEAKAGAEGKLFGSVTNADLVAALAKQTGITVDRHFIDSHQPIKTLGVHTVSIKLHTEVHVDIKIEVVSQDHALA